MTLKGGVFISIHQISRKSLPQSIQGEQKLKTGQIIQGKIIKIYPENKAQIKLGSKVMIAQLEVSLVLGGKYVFQVENTADILQLKVITDQSKSKENTNIADIIKSLGLKASKINVEFTNTLINQRIPVDRNQLAKAYELLNQVKNKQVGQNILKEMIIQKTPLTESIFKALIVNNTSELSELMTGLLKELKNHGNQTVLTQNIINQLTEMTVQPLSPQNQLIVQILSELSNQNPDTFNVLKAIGFIKNQIDYSSWKSTWQAFASQHSITPSSVSNTKFNNVSLPLEFNEKNVTALASQLRSVEQPLKTASQDLVTKWSKIINEAFIKDTALNARKYTQFKLDINQKLLPLLSNTQRTEFTKLMENNPVYLRQLLTAIQPFTLDSLYTKNEEVFSILTQQAQNMVSSPNELFMRQLNQMLLFTGITDENILAQALLQREPLTLKQSSSTINDLLNGKIRFTPQEFIRLNQEITVHLLPLLIGSDKEKLTKLMNNNPEQLYKLTAIIRSIANENALFQEIISKETTSLKSMLIQMVSQSEQPNSQAKQLIHFINGLQLQSVNETSNFIQASLQMPGETLSLNKDLYIDFESKKTVDGKINSDFCRIMFYLDLKNLEKTVIDMQVQKRVISVTVFNDQKEMPKEFKVLQSLLKTGLAKLDYRLSRVSIKPLSNMNDSGANLMNNKIKPIENKSYKGIDFQI